MNNKFKRVLTLLFVVSTLLLMIGSVCASDVELNDNLETSLDLDEGLSVGDSSISNPDNKVSDQLTVSNIDEETDTQCVEEDLIDLNSNDVVSNDEDTTINTKDSDKNIKTANQLGDAQFVLENVALNSSASVGDYIYFQFFGRNNGTNFGEDFVPIHMLFDHNELEYIGFTVGTNPDLPGVDFTDAYSFENVSDDEKLFKYNSGGWFDNGHCFNLTVQFKVRTEGNPGCFMYVNDWDAGKAARTDVYDSPVFYLENTLSNQTAYVGDYISFTIFGRNKGTNFGEDYVPIHMLFDHNELEFIGYTVGVNPDMPGVDFTNAYSYENVSADEKLFKYNSSGWFDNGHCFNFTATFKVLKPGNPGTFVYVNDWNRGVANRTVVIDPTIFTITNKGNDTIRPGASGNVNYGGIASFEIFVRNIGGNFYEYVPIDIYFDPDELDYVNYTVGVNPDAPWFVANDNYNVSLVEPGHVKVLYNYAPFSSFENNNCMNFTVNFETKKLGEVSTNAVINWTQGDNYQVNASGSTVVGLDTDFKLEYTPSALIVNVNEIVAYDVVVTNLGGNYSGWVGIDIVYNAEELEYINFTPNFNPENYDTYSAAGTPNPIDKGDGVNGHLYFGYMNAPCIENGHVFNFTINFKPLKECEESVKFVTNASIDWWQIEHHSVKDSAYVFVTDADFVLDIVPSTTDLLKIGDSVSFDVVAHNLDGSFYGSYIGFDLFFDPDELEYKSFNINDQPDGLFKLEYGGVTGQSIGNGLLGAVSLTTDEGHLHFGFTPSESLKASMADGTNTDCSFNFTINYNVKDNGLLMNNAELAWGEGEDQKVLAAAAVSAGEESFILTKTPEQDKVTVGDDVYFTFYLENTGADIYGYRTIYAEDWYPGGELEYVDAVVNSNSTPVNIVPVSGQYHLYIYQNTTNNYWRNGDYFNVTLHFIVKEPGVHCNHAFFRGNSTTGTVFTDEPNMNLTKTTREEVVNEGQYVYFDILLENLEDSIPYYDHVHETTDVVLTDVYPDSIEYVSCTLNKDTQGNGKLNVVDNGNNLTIRYTPEGSRWFQGNSINITLMFKAVKPGSFKNEVDFFWKWKDVGSEENVTLTSESPFIIGTPDFALEKISNFETAKVGDIVSFTIIYTNNGTLPLTGVYIVDNDYSDGLVYSDYSDKDSWTFDGKDKWTYNEDLQPGDAATLVLYFEATSTGEKNNTAIAGNNEMDETKNSTDIVLIKDKELDSAEDADEPDGSEEDDETDDVPDSNPEDADEPVEEETVEEPTPSVAKTASLPAAGNPLVILLMSLLTLCFVPIRGKK